MMKIYKFKSEESLNQFVANVPFTDRHNIIFASLIGLEPFKTCIREEHKHLTEVSLWVHKGGQDFFIAHDEMKFFEHVEV